MFKDILGTSNKVGVEVHGPSQNQALALWNSEAHYLLGHMKTWTDDVVFKTKGTEFL